jgi:hypothetical protein
VKVSDAELGSLSQTKVFVEKPVQSLVVFTDDIYKNFGKISHFSR